MARNLFRSMMKQRRAFQRDSLDWQWRTRAAIKYLALYRKQPTQEWT